MSLAVSAILAPSRRLRCVLAAFRAALCAAALAVGLIAPGRFAGGPALALLPLLAALAVARLPPSATVRRIDISGVGQLRLTVQQEVGAGAPAAAGAAPALPMTLLPGATVWPCCMVLRLRAAAGATVVPLLLLPDMVGAGQYRALAVALRALANGAATPPGQNRLNLLQGANS